jgi:hypothetical protein
MALNAKNVSGGGAPRIAQANLPAGNYPVRVVQIIDYGIQPQRPYKGEDKPPAQEIGLTYEFLDEFMKDENGEEQLDKPRWLSENFILHNLRADKARSTQRYTALDPKGVHDGDFSQLLETPAMLTVVNNAGKEGKVYDNVGALSPMRPRDAANAPALVNKAVFFDLDAPNMEVFGKFPKWIQEKIQGNLNFQGSPLQRALNGGKTEDKYQGKSSVGAEKGMDRSSTGGASRAGREEELVGKLGNEQDDDNNPY